MLNVMSNSSMNRMLQIYYESVERRFLNGCKEFCEKLFLYTYYVFGVL